MTGYQLPKAMRPTKKKWNAFVVPDVHRGYNAGLPAYDPMVWDVGIQALKHYAPHLTHLIILGDYGNFESLSHWSAMRAEQVFIEEDIAIVDHGLREMETVVDKYKIKKIFIEGNHEAWATTLEAKYPALRNMVNLQKRLDMKKRGWTWIPNNHFYKLGQLYFTHGNVMGASNAAAMIRRTGKSVMYGHTHGHEVANHRTLTDEHVAMSNGCWAMIDPPPPYAKGMLPDRWVHGFSTVGFRSNGLFTPRWHPIIESQMCEMTNGTEILANRKTVQQRLSVEDDLLQQLRNEYTDRYYSPTGSVHELEPIGTGEYSARSKRARIHADRTKRS